MAKVMATEQVQTTSCCTCARDFDSWEVNSEKPLEPRVLDCCGRVICGHCQTKNSRFREYCPFCQISTGTSSRLLPPGLKDPPEYSPPTTKMNTDGIDDRIDSRSLREDEDELPSYESLTSKQEPAPEKSSSNNQPPEDVLHFLHHPHDTLLSLAFRYGVPINELRNKNNLWSDHLLAARKTILIPGEFYSGGVSLSPRPIDGEEEELQKTKVRRFMVSCKVADYDVALIYLRQADYDLEKAVAEFKEEERWELEHPLDKGKNKTKQPEMRSRFFGRF